MDCKDRIITEIDSIYPFLTEAYLLTLTNKGIYNRAHKDLEKSKDCLKVVWNEEQLKLQVQLEEGVCVTLRNPIQDSQCTCPSQSLCRHIMTALLYCKGYYEENKPSDAASKADNDESSEYASKADNGELNDYISKANRDEPNHCTGSHDKHNNSHRCKDAEQKMEIVADLPELDALTEEEIAKCFGKKMYNEALKKWEHLGEISYTYGAFVTVVLKDKFTIYFTKSNTLDQAVCSCKERGLCAHKLYALIAYLKKERKRELHPIEEAFKWGEQEDSCCMELKKEISLILDKGLGNLTERSINKVERLYINAYSCKFYELASELKSLSGELIYYFSRNVAFSNKRTMHLLCRIYNRLEAMEAQKQDQAKLKYLLGKLRQESLELDELHLLGLGARCFLTKRQDLVIMGYFYCQEVQRIVTMSTLRPLEGNSNNQGNSSLSRGLNKSIEYLYSAPLVWEDEFAFESLMSAKVILEKGVLKEGKLSTTKKSKGKVVGETTIEDVSPLAIEDYEALKEALKTQKQCYFEPYAIRQNTYVVKPDTISEMIYNKVTQRLEFTVYDQKGETIAFYLPYNAITDTIISTLEKGKNQVYTYILGHVFLKGDHIEAELLCLFHQKGGKSQWKI